MIYEHTKARASEGKMAGEQQEGNAFRYRGISRSDEGYHACISSCALFLCGGIDEDLRPCWYACLRAEPACSVGSYLVRSLFLSRSLVLFCSTLPTSHRRHHRLGTHFSRYRSEQKAPATQEAVRLKALAQKAPIVDR